MSVFPACNVSRLWFYPPLWNHGNAGERALPVVTSAGSYGQLFLFNDNELIVRPLIHVTQLDPLTFQFNTRYTHLIDTAAEII